MFSYENLSLKKLQGITIRSEEYGLVVARILEGSMIDKQGYLISFFSCTQKDYFGYFKNA